MDEFELSPEIKLPRPSLKDVHNIFKKWIYLEDTGRIDVALALRLISRITGTRVWMLFVGPSGDWKSELINSLKDDGQETKYLRNITARTLVSGNPRVQDLAPTLNNKTVLISDMAQILKLHPNEKAEVWAQLRDLYDGYAGKQSGLGKDAEYDGLNVTFLGASTPAIDSQILIHQDLGTRELIWRTERAEKTKTMEMVWDNEKVEDIMRYELKAITENFLKSREYDKTIEVPEEIRKQIFYQALKLTYLRSPAETDGYTGELLNQVHPEKPTRILKQLKRIYLGLKSLDKDYPDEEALRIIKHIVASSSFKNRAEILDLLLENAHIRLTTNSIAEHIKIGYKACFKELSILWNLGFIDRKADYDERFEKVSKCSWIVNPKNNLVEKLMEEKGILVRTKEEVVD